MDDGADAGEEIGEIGLAGLGVEILHAQRGRLHRLDDEGAHLAARLVDLVGIPTGAASTAALAPLLALAAPG